MLDRMATNRELYLAVDAENGRMLRLLTESTGAKQVVEIGTSTGNRACGPASRCEPPGAG